MFKNKLQEYCQKHSIDIPKYKSQQIPESLVWQTTVIFQGKEYTSETTNKKKESEQSVANIILQSLQAEDVTQAQLETNSDMYYTTASELCAQLLDDENKHYTTICLIDVESIPQALSIQDVPANVFIVGVVGYTHDKYSSPFPYHKYVIKSSMKDAVDHTITYLAGYIVSLLTSPRKFIIVTRDHFGEVISHLLKGEKNKAYHVTTKKDLLLMINEIQLKENSE